VQVYKEKRISITFLPTHSPKLARVELCFAHFRKSIIKTTMKLAVRLQTEEGIVLLKKSSRMIEKTLF